VYAHVIHLVPHLLSHPPKRVMAMTKNLMKMLSMSLFLAACSSELGSQSGTASVDPTYVDGNPTCADLGLGSVSYKVDPPNSGEYTIDDGVNKVTIATADGITFDWTSTLGIDAVIVKGGANANVYAYDAESFGDTILVSPVNERNGTPFALSHIDFCFDYEVTVTKTAQTSLTRTWAWQIDKTGDASSLLLSAGQTYLMGYNVVVGATGSTDSDWAVSGVITVANPSPFTATVTSVTDEMDGGLTAEVVCDSELPAEIPAWGSLTCHYASALSDATTLTNTATATTTGMVGGGSGTALVDFASAAVTGVDACVTVSDDRVGDLGTVCAADRARTFQYTLEIGYAKCGDQVYDNTATFVTADLGLTGSDSWSVAVQVPCATGCTLTQGYWKTHSSYGPAPYDSTWALLADGANTAFFLSGQSYHQVLWTAPAGNPYYVLAHQYIAAQLNGLNGADLGAVQAAFDAATVLFNRYSPATRLSATVRNSFLVLAAQLDAYNNGLAVGGPLHCSE
jgi:hypothetical protein